MTCSVAAWTAAVAIIAAGLANVEGSAAGTRGQSQGRLPATFAKLLPLHRTLAPPEPGEWLAEHKEPGQSYADYVHGRPAALKAGDA